MSRPRTYNPAEHIGKKYGQWTVVSFNEARSYPNTSKYYHNVRCECGFERTLFLSQFTKFHEHCTGRHKGEDLSDPSIYVGKQINRWTILNFAREERKDYGRVKYRSLYYTCKCQCGTIREVPLGNLKSGNSRGCSECAGLYYKHDEVKRHPLYQKYLKVNNCPEGVCDRWKDFKTFVSDVGERPSKAHFFQRKDYRQGYSPENFEWTTERHGGRLAILHNDNIETLPVSAERKRQLRLEHQGHCRKVKCNKPLFRYGFCEGHFKKFYKQRKRKQNENV